MKVKKKKISKILHNSINAVEVHELNSLFKVEQWFRASSWTNSELKEIRTWRVLNLTNKI